MNLKFVPKCPCDPFQLGKFTSLIMNTNINVNKFHKSIFIIYFIAYEICFINTNINMLKFCVFNTL